MICDNKFLTKATQMRISGIITAILVFFGLMSGLIVLNTISKLNEGGKWSKNVLALSWQPAFCEYKPFKIECGELNAGKLPHTQKGLSVHGLWPQPRDNIYCGVSEKVIATDKAGSWTFLPKPNLTPKMAKALIKAMPGVASFLDRHEWVKHGTCYRGTGAGDYYGDTLMLLSQINSSAVGHYLADHLGEVVDTKTIRSLFDQSFGKGAGERVSFKCWNDGDRVLLQELFINLRGDISGETPISDLLLAASTRSIGCKRGLIDRMGLQ